MASSWSRTSGGTSTTRTGSSTRSSTSRFRRSNRKRRPRRVASSSSAAPQAPSELVTQRELHAAARLRVAGGQRTVVAAEAGAIREHVQLADVELRRVGQVEDVPPEPEPVVLDAGRERLRDAEVDH